MIQESILRNNRKYIVGDNMKKIYKYKYIKPPYSLHDVKIVGLKFDDGNLLLETQYGYFQTQLPYKEVDGDLMITDVSTEDSYAHIMEYEDVLCGNVGKFHGEKMELKNFIEKFGDEFLSFDIHDESFGFNNYKFTGFLIGKGIKIYEIILDIFFTGDIIYLLEEGKNEI